MILSDFHCHTAFSSDSDATPESVIESAIQKGLKYICITDHYDYLFPEQYKDSFTFSIPEYTDRLNQLRETYRNQIAIFTGVELGLRNEPGICQKCIDFYEQLDKDYNFDFLIGSTHILDSLDPYYPEYWELHSVSEGLSAYFESIVENIRNYDSYQVYGHLDYIVRYVPKKNRRSAPFDYRYSDFSDYIEEILKGLISRGKGLELNTAGLKYGLPSPHPKAEILKRYRELGGEIITIGSDGHKPEHIAYDFSAAEDFLKSLGFRYYTIFQNKNPEFLPL